MKFKIDTAIAIVAVIVAVFTFFASPLWNQRFREERKLEYAIQQSSISPRTADSKIWKGIYLQTEDGQRLDGAVTWAVSITNVGLVPITKADLEGPISIHFDKSGALVRAQVVDTEPSGLNVKVELVDDNARIDPLLLNPGDGILVFVLAKDDAKLTRVTARGPALSIGERKSKRESGLYVATVQELGSGGSTYRTHYQLPVWVLVITMVFFTFLASISYAIGIAAIGRKFSEFRPILWLLGGLVFFLFALGTTLLLQRALLLLGLATNVASWAPLMAMALVVLLTYLLRNPIFQQLRQPGSLAQ